MAVSAEDTTTVEPVEEEIVEEEDSSQVTIYAYRAENKIRLCPLCDGENDASATHCHICGRKLN